MGTERVHAKMTSFWVTSRDHTAHPTLHSQCFRKASKFNALNKPPTRIRLTPPSIRVRIEPPDVITLSGGPHAELGFCRGETYFSPAIGRKWGETSFSPGEIVSPRQKWQKVREKFKHPKICGKTV